MKYKVGDVVRVRRDLVVTYFFESPIFYGGFHCTDYMSEFFGKKVTIKSIDTNRVSPHYHIVEDRIGCAWTDEMFEDSKLEDFLRCLKSEI